VVVNNDTPTLPYLHDPSEVKTWLVPTIGATRFRTGLLRQGDDAATGLMPVPKNHRCRKRCLQELTTSTAVDHFREADIRY
jgi:hypothetical protein